MPTSDGTDSGWENDWIDLGGEGSHALRGFHYGFPRGRANYNGKLPILPVRHTPGSIRPRRSTK